MAPKAPPPEPPPPPPPPKPEEELQGVMATGVKKAFENKLLEIKAIGATPESLRPMRIVLYLPEIDMATQPNLHEVIASAPPTIVELSLIYSTQLIALPDLSPLTTLRCLNLNMCENLEALPPSVSSLLALEFLDISWCAKLATVPDLTPLIKLIKMDCAGCRSLRVELLKLPPQLKPNWSEQSRSGFRKPDHYYPLPKLPPLLKSPAPRRSTPL